MRVIHLTLHAVMLLIIGYTAIADNAYGACTNALVMTAGCFE